MIYTQHVQVHSKYDLYAVLLHIGSLEFGHYFCCIRSSPSTWHCINDSKANSDKISFFFLTELPWEGGIIMVLTF